MKRPPGLIVSAVLLLLASLLQALFAGLGALAAAITPRQPLPPAYPGAPPLAQPAWMHFMMYAVCAFLLALAVWGILTAVGLLRVRRWARYSILVIGGGMAMIGFVSMLAMLLLMLIPLPLPPNVGPSHAPTLQAHVRLIFGFIALFHAIMTALGVFWLVYFNLKRARDLFLSAPGTVQESRRPFLVSLVAVLLFLAIPSCLLLALLPLPAPFFGLTLHGWAKAAVYLAYAALAALAAVGLWRLKEWSRRLTLALMALRVIQSAIYFVHPSLLLPYSREIDRAMNLPQPPMPEHFLTTIYAFSFGWSILYMLAVVAVLHCYRKRFEPPVTQPPNLPVPLA